MAANKFLTVATAAQRAVFDLVLRTEIATGFWKDGRPADHADSWRGVEVRVGTVYGASGFDAPRNYNFVNPQFFSKNEAKLMSAALSVDPNITVKQLKKQLISLNQIIGDRLKETGGVATKLPRGRKQSSTITKTTVKAEGKSTTKRVAANFTEEIQETAS